MPGCQPFVLTRYLQVPAVFLEVVQHFRRVFLPQFALRVEFQIHDMNRFAEQFQQGVGNGGEVVLDGKVQIGVLFLRLL